MDKSFINKARKDIKIKKSPKVDNKTKTKKHILFVDNNEYKSENVFDEESLSKCKRREQTPYNPKKRSNSSNEHLNRLSKVKKLSFEDNEEEISPIIKKKTVKTKQHKPTPYKPKISTNLSPINNLKTKLFEFNESLCSENVKKGKSVAKREPTPFKPKKQATSSNLWLKEENASFNVSLSEENASTSSENQVSVNGKKKTRKLTPYYPRNRTNSLKKSVKKQKLSFIDDTEHSFENLFHSSDIKDEDESIISIHEFTNSMESSFKKEKLSFNDNTEDSFENLIHSSDLKDEAESSCIKNSIINDSSVNKTDEISVLNNSICSNGKIENSSKDSNIEKIEIAQNECQIDNIKPKFSYKPFQNCKMVAIEENSTIPIHGLMSFRVIDGEIQVLGHKIKNSDKKYNFYSPKGSALLTVTTTTKKSIVSCETLTDNRINFVDKLIPQHLFPQPEPNNQPQIVFEPTNFNVQQYDDENWSKLIDGLDVKSKLMIVGGKSTGKSTFLRYCINKLLNKYDKVRIIDLDPGQSEFTIPGCISIVTINETIFGPNYTHLLHPEKSILVDINLNDPQHYLQAIKLLIENINQESGPFIVNTMGYNHGLGINIISTTIFYVQPTDIVEIRSRYSKKKFPISFQMEIFE